MRAGDPSQPRTGVIRVGTFGGASGFPTRIAIERGEFDKRGLIVEVEVVSSSDRLRDGLLEGFFQVVHAAADNVIAWSDREDAGIVAWIGGSNGPIALVANSATTIPELRATRIGIDAPSSGFIPILRRLMLSADLTIDGVEVVVIGATRLRYAALLDDRIDATLLTVPWSILAVAAGARVLGDHRDVTSGLLTSCGASMPGWLASAPSAADAYLGGLRAAIGWLVAPDNRAAATRALAVDLGVEPGVADEVLTLLIDPIDGWPRAGRIDPVAMQVVCDLRADVVGAPARTVDAYVDLAPQRRVDRALEP